MIFTPFRDYSLCHSKKDTDHMQISRHWRLNSQRYFLKGSKKNNGELSIQSAGKESAPVCFSQDPRVAAEIAAGIGIGSGIFVNGVLVLATTAAKQVA